MTNNRPQKVAHELQIRINNILQNQYLHLCHGTMVTISKVEMSYDLSLAKVFLSIYGGESEEKAAECYKLIVKDIKKIRKEMGQGLLMRHIPNIRFELDTSLDYVEKIDRLLRTLKQ